MFRFVRAGLIAAAIAIAPTPSAVAGESIRLPAELEVHETLLGRYWLWLREEVGMPAGVPAPRIEVGPLPVNVDMAFYYPTHLVPHHRLLIVMSERSIGRAEAGGDLVVLGGIAHEVVHYVLLLAENDWDHERGSFENRLHHHCDQEFQRLTRHVGKIIWDAYHSNDTVRAIDRMVQLSCWEGGHDLNAERAPERR